VVPGARPESGKARCRPGLRRLGRFGPHGSFRFGRLGVFGPDAVVAFLVQFLGQFRTAAFDDPAAQHHVHPVRRIVFQQFVVVGDDEQAHFFPADFGDALAGQPHGVHVQAMSSLM